jgi:hypothetical protein
MQAIGSIVLFAGGVVAFSGLSAFLYSALPEAVLSYAERHGRFQGLRVQETLANGTRAGQPPVEQQAVLAVQMAQAE